jgi:lipid-A-disaccharide synthase-like uncharacterized protein
MKETQLWVFAVGFSAQLLFGSRMIIQWFHSEKAGKSLSPTIFWQLSLLGSIIFLFYGILRKDFAIVLGQCLVYYIYIRNLHLKNSWMLMPFGLRLFVLLVPVLTLGYLFSNYPGNIFDILSNKGISTWLKIWGSLGQIIFTLRFYIQWINSEAYKQSVLSRQFWIVSLIGSVMILSYAIFRRDPVLFLGQLTGLLVYIRNLMFLKNVKNKNGVPESSIFDKTKTGR